MRVTGGNFRGIPLSGPKDQSIRPTSDKARLAIFNSLLSGKFGIDLEDAIVLDGTAGTGAMGIEALSRGAKFCHFADPSRDAQTIVRQNLMKVKVTEFKLYSCAAQALPQAAEPCTIIFLDPPYGKNLLPEMLQHLKAEHWINADTLLVLEEDAKARLDLPVTVLEQKIYGAAQVLYATMPM